MTARGEMIRAGLFGVSLAGTLLAGATSASAQDGVIVDRAEIRATAECVVQSEPRKTAAFLATLPGSPDEQRLGRKLEDIFQGCMGETRKVARGEMDGPRNALAVAMVVRIQRGTPLARGAPWYRTASAGKAAYSSYDPHRLGAIEFGSCVMAAAPAAAEALVRSAPDSAAEGEAVRALRPVLAPCMTHDTILRLKPDDLRNVLGEPVYHALAG